jgi:hypothetical protein
MYIWAKALKDVPPKKVEVDMTPIYNRASKRPIGFRVNEVVGGVKKTFKGFN